MPPDAPRIFIGTSGWTYEHWRGRFFPKGLRRKDELAYLAARMNSVEVNGTFYSLTRPTACEQWRAATSEDFVFSIKGSRYITHLLKLKEVDAALANFFASGILRLGKKLGPILWQLPPFLAFNRERAEEFFAKLPRTIPAAEKWARRHDARTTGRAALKAPDGRDAPLRHALEVRHPSWLADEPLALMREYGISLVSSDMAGKYPLVFEQTAGFRYARLHGSSVLYSSQYTDDELASWATRIRAWQAAGEDVYVFFDNDAKVHAPTDALRLRAAVDGVPGASSDAPNGPSPSFVAPAHSPA